MSKLMLPRVMIFVSLILFLSLSNTSKSFASYGDVLFFDDFGDNNDVGWTKIHDYGTNTIPLWNISAGKYGMSLNYPSSAGNSIAGNESWGNYSYEFDMSPLAGVDRNFIFRVSESSPGIYYLYEIHASGNYIYASKAAPSDPSKPLDFTGSSYFEIVNGKIYNWKVEVVDNNTKIYVKDSTLTTYTKLFDITDNNIPLLHGKIGLRIGTGATYPTRIYFDNIKVTDLTVEPTPTPTLVPTPTLEPTPTPTPTLTPTPSPTPFPYFSQIDQTWKKTPYDKINKTIGQVGCALTSLTMVLKSYGLDQVPWGDQLRDLNPATLNAWLNQQATGWTQNAGPNPSAITKLTKALNSSDSAKYIKLELSSVTKPSTTFIDETLAKPQPLIINHPWSASSTNVHFVVAHKQLAADIGKLYAINDPYDSGRTQFAMPPNSINYLWHFYPTNSDFSYLYLESDDRLYATLENSLHQKTGFLNASQTVNNIPNSLAMIDTPIADVETPDDNYIGTQLSTQIKYPATDTYKLRFSTDLTGWYSYSIAAFNVDSQDEKIDKRIFIDSRYPHNYSLKYNHDGQLPIASVQKVVSFDSLKALIRSSYDQKWIPQSKTRDQLLLSVDVIRFVAAYSHQKAKLLLRPLISLEKYLFSQGKIKEPGYSLILDETTLLLSQL